MIEIRVSIRYARAIMNAAKELNITDRIFEDLNYINHIFDNSKDFFAVFKSPVVSNAKKRSLAKEIFGEKISELTFSLLELIISKNREFLIESIGREYTNLYYKYKNMLPINVTTAIEMDENTKNGILNKLTEITGMTVVPDYTIDSKIKGGLKVQIDTWVYDASISNKLNALYTKLTTGN